MRTPAWKILSGGSTSLESLAHAGAATRTVSFFDRDVKTDFKLPFELKAGVGWVGSRAQIEVDVFAYTGTGKYPALESGNIATVVSDDGQGRVPVTTTQQFGSPVVDSRAVVNVAIGGRYALTANGALVLHGGFAADRSPVGDEDTVFGVHESASAQSHRGSQPAHEMAARLNGVHYATGRSNPLTLRRAADGFVYATEFSVSTVGIVYSLAVLF